jgi:hypothetical protein
MGLFYLAERFNQPAMKIAVIGSRGISRIDCDRIGARHGDVIVSGGARGVDSLAAAWARRNGLAVVEHLPDYASYGKAAPHVRNRKIVADADRVVAFWDGKSRGTKSTIDKAVLHGKRVDIVMC